MTDIRIRMLVHIAKHHGGVQRSWAKHLGVSDTAVHKALVGRKPTKSMLDDMGLKKVVTYEEVINEQN